FQAHGVHTRCRWPAATDSEARDDAILEEAQCPAGQATTRGLSRPVHAAATQSHCTVILSSGAQVAAERDRATGRDIAQWTNIGLIVVGHARIDTRGESGTIVLQWQLNAVGHAPTKNFQGQVAV